MTESFPFSHPASFAGATDSRLVHFNIKAGILWAAFLQPVSADHPVSHMMHLILVSCKMFHRAEKSQGRAAAVVREHE